MNKFKLDEIDVEVVPDNIKILNSYKIKTKKEMKKYILKILDAAPLYQRNRSVNALVREWKSHNRLYNSGLFVEHTRDCDLQSKEALHRRFVYFFLGRF